ncbi:MAG: Na+/H+ antiporter subunit E [Endomicrobiales bacterium]
MNKSKAVLFILLLLAWTAFSWSLDLAHLASGAVFSFIVTLLVGALFTSHAGKFLEPRRYLWLALFTLACLRDAVKANLDAAWRLLHPALPVQPAVVRVKTRLKNAVALSFLANTLTLVKGTMTIDLDPEKGSIEVHCSDRGKGSGAASVQSTVDRYDAMLVRIFE